MMEITYCDLQDIRLCPIKILTFSLTFTNTSIAYLPMLTYPILAFFQGFKIFLIISDKQIFCFLFSFHFLVRPVKQF